MDDAESQTPHGDPETNAARRYPCWLIVVMGVLAGAFITLCFFMPYLRIHARYTVAADSVSSTDSNTGLSFNLTLGVASQSYVSDACIKPGTYMEVTYRGVQIAASVPETRFICVKPWKKKDEKVLAMTTTVLGGNVLDSLVAEMKRGVAVFDVRLHLPAGSYDMMPAWVSGCKGMRVGQGAVACEFLI
ncbi:hypothetical protein VPH35_113930 [Triticum aestivum]